MKAASLITLLTATDAVSSLLSSPGAVYNSVLPRGYKMPAIVVHRYNGSQDQDMTGPVDAREDSFQLDIYAGAADVCDAITDACRTLLTGFTSTEVQGTYLEQDRDMPFVSNANKESVGFRSLLGFRFVSKV
jgi:Protein of unknown function (DUF3168)